MNSGIYKIINKINGKIYVGSAINFRNRKYVHFSQLKRGVHHSTYLQRSFNKYGITKFNFVLIEYCSIDKLIEREQYYLDNLNPEYNTCKIAGSTLGSITSKRKKVIQFSLKGKQLKVWDCLQDIMIHFNISNSTKISQVCRNKRKSAYGFIWRYVGTDFLPFSYNGKRKGKKICEVNENEDIINSWDRLKDCAKDIGTSPSVLCNILSKNRKNKTFNGRLFKRLEQ